VTEQAELTKVVVALWAIWHARRKALHEDIYQSPMSTFTFINRFIDDLNVLQTPVKQKEGGSRPVHRSIPPPSGMCKINVDAALSKNTDKAAISATARDVTGSFLGASSLVISGVNDSEILEAEACREGLALATDLNLTRVRLASDCSNIVRMINAAELLGEYGQIIREIQALKLDFVSLEVLHENRRQGRIYVGRGPLPSLRHGP
jgi:ribonuclease HI